MDTIYCLPCEILDIIFDYAKDASFIIAGVCKEWRCIVSEERRNKIPARYAGSTLSLVEYTLESFKQLVELKKVEEKHIEEVPELEVLANFTTRIIKEYLRAILATGSLPAFKLVEPVVGRELISTLVIQTSIEIIVYMIDKGYKLSRCAIMYSLRCCKVTSDALEKIMDYLDREYDRPYEQEKIRRDLTTISVKNNNRSIMDCQRLRMSPDDANYAMGVAAHYNNTGAIKYLAETFPDAKLDSVFELIFTKRSTIGVLEKLGKISNDIFTADECANYIFRIRPDVFRWFLRNCDIKGIVLDRPQPSRYINIFRIMNAMRGIKSIKGVAKCDIVKLVSSNIGYIHWELVHSTCARGMIDHLKWLHNNGHPVDITGQIYKKFSRTDDSLICRAIMSGNLDCIMWLREIGCPLLPQYCTVSPKYTIELLKLAISDGERIPRTLLSSLVESRNQMAIEWFLENIRDPSVRVFIGFKWQGRIFKNSDCDLIRLLHDHGVGIDLSYAAQSWSYCHYIAAGLIRELNQD